MKVDPNKISQIAFRGGRTTEVVEKIAEQTAKNASNVITEAAPGIIEGIKSLLTSILR